MKHGSLFSGIGGFDLAAEWMGWDNKFHCEWNPFLQKILHYYWPNAEQFTDITKTDFTKYANKIDILTGGFPCQPYSQAGKRKGKNDTRHLWPHMYRAIAEIRPRWVVGENVRGIINWNEGLVFNEIQIEMEALGYETISFLLPANAVNSPQKRNRIFFISYTNKMAGRGLGECKNENTQQRQKEIGGKDRCKFHLVLNGNLFEVWNDRKQEYVCESPLISRINGFSDRLDGIAFSKWCNESNGAYGNSVVPQLVFMIFKAIEQYEKINQKP